MANDVGRPSKFTDEARQIIVDCSRRGVFAHVAARAAGVSPSTFYAWMAAGHAEEKRVEAGSEPDPAAAAYLEFSEDVNRARATARGYAEARVWQDNPERWLLQGPGRDKPGDEGWATTTKHEHTGADGGPMETMDLSKLTADQLREWHKLASIAEADGDPA